MYDSYNQMINNKESIKKPKKTINVSIQSKKYSAPINKILDKWEKSGLNASNEVSENILLVDKLNKSITFSNIFNVYELIEKMVGLYEDLDSPSAFLKIESILSEVITIDNSKISSVLSLLNEEYVRNINNTNSPNNVNIESSYNNSNSTIDNNNHKYNTDNGYATDIPHRKSRQSDNNNVSDDYNYQNNQNMHSNNKYGHDNNKNGYMEADLIEEEISIPINFLSND